MRIAMMGTGGVGGYFGSRLVAAGEDVVFIARGAHGAAIAERGLTVESGVAPVAGLTVKVTDDPASVGPVDLVIFAVKLWDTESAAEQIRPMIGPDTVVLPFQNGVDAAARISAVIGGDHVAGGVAHIGTTIASPGVIRHIGTLARLTFGRFGDGESPVLAGLAAALARAGVDHQVSPRIERVLWEKFVFLSALSAATAVTRLPVGPIRQDPDMRAFLFDAAAETVAVASARGVGLAADHLARLPAMIDALPGEMKASMAHDLERGQRLELPWLSGAVVRMGAEAGVPTPVHRAVWCALKAYKDGPPA